MYHGAISTSQLPEVFEEEEEESSHDYFDSENRNRNRHDSGIEESFPSRQRSEFFFIFHVAYMDFIQSAIFI